MARGSGSEATIGFTVKSGWAAAVVLSGSRESPIVAECVRVELSDPDDADARQPYHAGFGTARAHDARLRQLVASVRKFGSQSVTRILHQCRERGHSISAAGLVVGSTVDPSTIANDHIRIHALEGKLFREVVAQAAADNGIACTTWRERDLSTAAAAALAVREATLKKSLSAMKPSAPGPWRSEQKLAATAAWILLAGPRR